VRAAYCDVDGTLTRTTIVTPMAWLMRRLLPPPWNRLWPLSLLVRGPWWLLLDRFSRAASNRSIYACYGGLSAADAQALGEACCHAMIRSRLFPAAEQWLNQQRREGVRIVFVTGSLDFLIQPLAREFEALCVAPALAVKDGCFTGQLVGPSMTGDLKARAVQTHAEVNGVDLSQSFALGDAAADLPMLECVGRPLAVNPDAGLRRIAVARHWPVLNWRD
jgi:HAD superfamily hydrolase (TIGR01490 family)